MRPLLVGFLAGIALWALRASLGLELLQVPALAAGAACAVRAAGLATVAIGLVLAGPRLARRPFAGRFVAGAAAGFAFRALAFEGDLGGAWTTLMLVGLAVAAVNLRGLGPARAALGGLGAGLLALALCLGAAPESHFALVAFVLGTLVAMAMAGRVAVFAADSARPGEAGAGGAGAGEAGADGWRPAPGELSGLALAGAGAAIAIEGIARHLCRFGAGEAADDALFGALFLAVAALGAGAFARLLSAQRERAIGRGLGPLLAAAGGIASLSVLANLAEGIELERYLRVLGSRTWRCGMLDYDLAIAAPVLVFPALLSGAAIVACRRPPQLAALLVGAGAGLALVPRLVGFDVALDELGRPLAAAGTPSAGLVGLGAGVAAAGAVLAVLGAGRGPGRVGRLACAALALAVGLWAWARPAAEIRVLFPWHLMPPAPSFVLETPEGLLAIEGAAGGLDVVTLDQYRLTPDLAGARADRQQIELAWRMLPPERRASGEARVLLVGQLTPGRALALSELGAAAIDRSASWQRAMPALEARLFGAAELPAGEVLSLSAARARIAAGVYDLILVPPVPGTSPATRNLASPPQTTAVVWLDARGDVARRPLGAEVLPCTVELLDLAVALAHGGGRAHLEGGGFGRPALVAAGEPIPPADPLDRLLMDRQERERDGKRRLARRLAGCAAEGTGAGALSLSVARFHAEQVRSSPFESRAQRIELSDEVLEQVRAAVGPGSPDAFTVQVVEALAAILREKRLVDRIVEYVEPIARLHYPWPALEEAVAHADLELLEPGLAAERLERLIAAAGGDGTRWAFLASAQAQAGRGEDAVASWWRALELEPQSRAIRRALAIQLARGGDPQGREMVRDLLLEEQQGDEGLRVYLGEGPFPEIEKGYHPIGRPPGHAGR